MVGILSSHLLGKRRVVINWVFPLIANHCEYQDAVPIRGYDEFELWIERVANGDSAVLTGEPVSAFDETSGSTGHSKLIPHTASLRVEFEAAVGPWMVAMSHHCPGAFSGCSYWSLSPPIKARFRTNAR